MTSTHGHHADTNRKPPPPPVFSQLKVSCVPLLANSQLSPSSIPLVSRLLSEVINTLTGAAREDGGLAPNLVHYVFIPISTIIRRNSSSAIPDQVLEKLFIVLRILLEVWWWSIDLQTWEQIYMLCGSIVMGLGDKGKERDRGDETREAAVQCLLRLLRGPPTDEESKPDPRRETNTARLTLHARSRQFFPIFGQTLTSVMETSLTTALSLQRACLQALRVMIEDYAPLYFVPSILPGVVSTMVKAALGTSTRKGWSNGEIVAEALGVMEIVVVRAIGDDVCVEEGAIRRTDDLEDLLELSTSAQAPVAEGSSEDTPYATKRTESWLRASSSQLHIAMNSLSSLPSHPTPSALLALCNFSCSVLSATTLTLPQTQPLLLSYLLSLSNAPYISVSEKASSHLAELLRPGTKTYHPLIQTLSNVTSDYLSSLPRLISIQSEAKVEHTARLIEAICRLCSRGPNGEERNPAIATRLQRLTGPMGGIEKWGWVLLSVLEFGEPEFSTADFSVAQILDVEYAGPVDVPFPELILKNITSRSTSSSLVHMLRALGQATGEGCIFAIEWFVGVGRKSKKRDAVAALWCAARLLEGAGEVSLDSSSGGIVRGRNKRIEKLARSVVKIISELWDEPKEDEVIQTTQDAQSQALADVVDENTLIEHKAGLLTVRPPGTSGSSQAKGRPAPQPHLHAVLSIQLLSISSGILQTRFSSLFLRVLYPVLHSVVSTNTHLSSTALAGLKYITNSTSYASPANLLLANFDYALDAISRRLSRRWLDLDATKVFVLLVRLIGKDIVEKAGDVVEECFDRLDEYHGYQVLVEGLVEVLVEVVRIVGEDESSRVDRTNENPPVEPRPPTDDERFEEFFHWLKHRDDVPVHEGEDTTDYGPTPRKAWGKESSETDQVGEAPNPVGEDPISTPTQLLTKQIVSRSIYFLTHSSPLIRARILTLLTNSIPVLPASAVLPSIHQAWPFVLNRFSDKEGWVVSAAAGLVESLSVNVGSFMQRRVWDDVWPKFRMLLDKLEAGDKSSALARRGYDGGIGTESAYSHSHRLYRSILRTVITGTQKVRTEDATLFEVILLFRRFLGRGVHEELQKYARELYIDVAKQNADAVWLVLEGTVGDIQGDDPRTKWLEEKWDIRGNVALVLGSIDG
ncbi:hypothetical protein BDM02DRAFT_3157819 [Thelephora ganbajun]|uniref:Uncharacterized protein n=1 Tax=Thelephora ganbajun TaxID=370292 RepID=A0ACB6ZXM9_THEGA|nr:hypothetical protein BDM02DRAFT_3157819 [Thelephora ganbajun]